MAYFHELMGHSHNSFTDKERSQAAELLKLYSDKEARALIEYAVREGQKTNFKMQHFGAILGYRDSWAATHVRASCELCHGSGMITVSDKEGTRVRVCSHGQTAPSS